MIAIETIVNSPVSSNCYIIVIGDECIIVDPGTDPPGELICFLEKQCCTPKYIILTHEHFDHIAGCNALRSFYFDAKLIASELCSRNIQDERWNLSRYKADDGVGFAVDEADIIIEKDQFLRLVGLDFYFMLTPGHSQGSMCFWFENSLFTGDMLIPGEKVIVKFKGGSKKDCDESYFKLFQLLNLKDFAIYPGHKNYFSV